MKNLSGRDIIVMGIQPWDISIGSNCKNIAEEFSKINRVLYVNAPLDRISRYREYKSEKVKKRVRVIQNKESMIEKINDQLWILTPDVISESVNWIGNPKLFDKLNFINNKRLTSSVKKWIEELKFSNFLMFNDQQMFLGQYMKELLNPDCYIYYIRDNLVKIPYWKKQGERLEPILISKSDVVVTNSVLYQEYAQQYNPHSYMVGQGCDTTIFDEMVTKIIVPEEMRSIPGPVIGYIGYLTTIRLDIELIKYVADQRPGWSIVLVGPEDEEFRSSELHSMKNVHFLGSREPGELPGYLKAFDIAINPQVLNEATIGNYPRKIDEYLTMGKPTVATKTRAMEYFKDVVYLAVSHPDYVQLIEKALNENNPELMKKRIDTGKSHTWENNVNEIYKSIGNI
jgi:glycosyltransferase involved in cell wall biosynthesis